MPRGRASPGENNPLNAGAPLAGASGEARGLLPLPPAEEGSMLLRVLRYQEAMTSLGRSSLSVS